MRLPYYGPRKAVISTINGKSHTDTIYHSIPSFKFVNQDGDTVTDQNYRNRIYVASFIFTSCKSTCPKIVSNLAVVQEKFQAADSVYLVSYTVNPQIDDVTVLKTYAQLVHANTQRWTFLTGSKVGIYKLAYNGYLLNAVEDTTQTDIQSRFLHATEVVLIDKQQHIRGIYDGTSLPDINKLVDDIKLLKADYEIQKEKQIKAPSM